MIRLEFGAADLAGVRFAHSPMVEVVTSASALTRPTIYPMYGAWRAQVRPRVAAARLDTFLALVAGPVHWIPDFLTAVPAQPRPLLRDELSRILETPLDQVVPDVLRCWSGHEAPPQIRRFATDPLGGLRVLTQEIRRYFEIALAPWWPGLRAAAESEIAQRARAATEHGPRALVEGLHPTLSWDGASLQIGPRGGPIDDCGLDGFPLTLFPSGFAGPKIFTMAESPLGRALFYPPRGAAALWDRPVREPGAALSALLGPTRAAVLTLLAVPHSTGEVAATLGLAAATASHHLTTLRDAGLIAGARDGRRLRYLRTGLGEQLGTLA